LKCPGLFLFETCTVRVLARFWRAQPEQRQCAAAFVETIPAGKNVRIELKNISGTITVESWNRDEIKLTATLESPKANLSPRQTGDALIVDVRATIADAAMSAT